MRVDEFKQLSQWIRRTIFSYCSLKDIVLKIRCLDKDNARLIANSEIVRENKKYTVFLDWLNKDC